MPKTQYIQLTLAEIRAFIISARWQTSQDGSHSYTLMKWNPDTIAMFYAIFEFIRRNGYVEIYEGRPYICFDIDGMRYWSMGAPLHETILINRTAIKAPAA